MTTTTSTPPSSGDADVTSQVRAITEDMRAESMAALSQLDRAVEEAKRCQLQHRAHRRWLTRHSDPARTRLLIVDDDPVILRALKRHLDGVTDAIDTAGGVRAAIKLARDRFYSVLVVDYMLLNGTARELVAEIRRASRRPTVHIILVSGVLTKEGGEATCRSIGANQWLAKPVDPLVLRDMVTGALAQLEHGGQVR